jgi:hypothetical protein
MTDRQGTRETPFDMASCMAMIEKMMAQQGAGCDCAEMMFQVRSQAGQGCCDCAGMMSQMMTMWGKTQSETDEHSHS